MKRIHRIVVLTFCVMTANIMSVMAQDGGTKFLSQPLDSVLAMAGRENKLIFADCYTTWCGPCRRMATEVFSTDTVGRFMNSRFLSTKIDMEKGQGPELARRWDINGYPTFVVLDHKGVEKFRLAGYFSPQHFVDTLTFMLSHAGPSAIRLRYEGGDHSPAVVAQYVDELMNRSERRKARAAVSECIGSNPAIVLTDTIAYSLFASHMTDPRDSVFQRVYSLRGGLAERYGQDALQNMDNVWRLGAKECYLYDDRQTFLGYDVKAMDDYERLMRRCGVEQAGVYTMSYKLPGSLPMADSVLLENLERSSTMAGISSAQWHYMAGQLQKRTSDTSILKRLQAAVGQRSATDKTAGAER